MYNIAICDDDKKDIEILTDLILRTNVVDTGLFQIYTFEAGEHLFFHQKMDFDLIIMDMQMGNMDGYETAMKLRQMDINFLLVFCSGVIMPVPHHFKAGAFRYLEKKNSEEDMLAELNDIVREMVKRKARPYLLSRCGSGRDQIRIYPESVLYIAIKGNGSQIVACGQIKEQYSGNAIRTSMNLNAVAEVFTEEYGFVRIHNSYIVNMDYIANITRTSVKLVDGSELGIARSKIKHFQQVFAQYGLSKH